MDRIQSQWRGKAKVVAYLDLIFTSMELFVVLVLAFMAGVFTAGVASVQALDKVQIDPNGPPIVISDDAKNVMAVGVGLVWFIVGITALISIIELWAAIQLMNATEIGRDHLESHRMCSTWRNVCIFVLLISIGLNVVNRSYIWLAITLLIRAAYLYIVHNFMEELRSTQPQPMTGISVMKQ